MGAGDLTGRKVLVTGASGFIGRRLVAALVKAGAEVTALGRTRHSAASLSGAPARFVQGSLSDASAMGSAIPGQEVIFNLAYDFRQSAAANIAAFETLISAAEAEGRARLVHASSIVVYDDWPKGSVSESAPMDRPGGSPYRRAKIAMERRLMAGKLPAAILQPTIVWGAGSSLWTDGFAEALLAGAVLVPEPEGLCQGVYVEDVVQACLRAATLAGLGQERFIVNGPAPFAWSALVKGYAQHLGRGEVRFAPAGDLAPPVAYSQMSASDDGTAQPPLAARISAIGRRLLGHQRFEALARRAKRQLKGAGEMRPDPHLFELMVARGHCPTDRARARFGYAPTYDLAAGLADLGPYLQKLAR